MLTNHEDRFSHNLTLYILQEFDPTRFSSTQAKSSLYHLPFSTGPRLVYSKTCLKWLLSKRPKHGFQDQLSLNAGQKYCRMLPLEHSAILSTFIKLPFVIKIFVLSIFEWPFYTGSTSLLSLYAG